MWDHFDILFCSANHFSSVNINVKGKYCAENKRKIRTKSSNYLPSFGKWMCRIIFHLYPVIFTGRNYVVIKVIFSHLFVILFTGGGICLNACWDTNPPPEQTHPPDQAHTPPGPGTPPDQAPPDQASPRTRHPLRPDTPPASTPLSPEQTPAYGLRAAGMHPTGMHSCIMFNQVKAEYLTQYLKVHFSKEMLSVNITSMKRGSVMPSVVNMTSHTSHRKLIGLK